MPPPGTQPLDKGSLQSCFARTAAALAAERTTVILIEDLHFAPEEGRALFTSLALAVREQRVLLIGTLRPGLADVWAAELSSQGHVERLDVPRLQPEELTALLGDAFGSRALAAEIGSEIARKSDGNPFFVFEILRGLREGQFITRAADGTWAATRAIERIAIPASVRDLVTARVSTLDDEQRELLDVAACLGHRFDAGLVGEVLGLARLSTLRQLGRIERRHRLVRSVGRLHQFDHHQVQETLYEELNEQLREELHGALADAMLERAGGAPIEGALAVDVADHFLKGGRGDRARPYVQAAHEHLGGPHLHRAAASLLDRILSVPGLLQGRDRLALLVQLARSLAPIGERARQEAAAREAVALAEHVDDAPLQAQARLALGEVLAALTRYDEARTILEDVRAAAQRAGDREALGGCLHALGDMLQNEGRFEDARACFDEQRTVERELGNARGEARAMANLALINWLEGKLPEARTQYEQYLELTIRTGDLAGQAAAHGNLGTVAYLSGDTPTARLEWEQFLTMARAIGDRMHEATATGNLGNAYRSEGRLVEAREHYERHLTMCQALGHGVGVATALVNLGATWTQAGELDRAHRALTRACEHCRTVNAPYPLGYALLDKSRVAHGRGDTPDARTFAAEALALRRSIGHGDGVVDALLELAALDVEGERPEAARTTADEALVLAREQGRPREVALALALLTRLPGGDVEAAERATAACEPEAVMGAHFHLWKATGKRAHLDAAKSALDLALERAPGYRTTMLRNVPLHRAIMDDAA